MWLIKSVGTAVAALLLSYPLWAPAPARGFFSEIAVLGPVGAPLAVTVFFGSVALYCRTLQCTLRLVDPEARAAAPASVWWMFAIPYNFVEDFFIVANIRTSLVADGRLSVAGLRIWTLVGYGWCFFQVVSLFPGDAAVLGAAAALPLWGFHWMLTHRFNRALARAARGIADHATQRS
jgi:hypothetical protein